MEPNSDPLIKELISAANQNLEIDGELLPMFFVHGKDGQTYCLGLQIIDGQKEQIASKMRHFAMEKDADWVMFMTECYMKKYDKKDDMSKEDGKPVRDREGRTEGVMFSLETLSDGCFTAMTSIKEWAGHKVMEPVKFEQSSYGGIFSNLLPDKKVVL